MPEEYLLISFNYQLEECNKAIQLEAVAEHIGAKPYFRIHSFRMQAAKTELPGPCKDHLLPPIEIRHIEKEGKRIWIHHDSEKESKLSSIIGKAIEEIQYHRPLKRG